MHVLDWASVDMSESTTFCESIVLQTAVTKTAGLGPTGRAFGSRYICGPRVNRGLVNRAESWYATHDHDHRGLVLSSDS